MDRVKYNATSPIPTKSPVNCLSHRADAVRRAEKTRDIRKKCRISGDNVEVGYFTSDMVLVSFWPAVSSE